ncbi:MAG: ABC transporter substrate-binding protein [Rhodothermia bacterium]|nr:ABC transporter substrate-binding protein [Rhodothermia bacterium]
MLQDRDAQIKRIIGARDDLSDKERETLKDVINGVIDFEAMSRSALGPHWEPLSSDQRDEFVNVFADIVRSQSLANLEVYRSKVTYDGIAVEGDRATVTTTTLYKDVPTKVVYTMSFHDGDWHVNDIVLDDVSTADGYARSFQSVVRKRGFDALMTSLVKRRDKEMSERSS